jgi:tetratricopeptide (TPR) repeat protein
MWRAFTIRNQAKEWLGHAVVATFLLLVFIATGCGGDADRRARSDDLSAGASQPAPTVSHASNISETPAPVASPRAILESVSFEDGELAFREKRYDDATAIFGAYLEREPDHTWGYYLLGLSAWKGGELERAETAFRRVLEFDHDHVRSLVNLSRVLLDADRPEEALPLVEEVIDIDPVLGEGYRLLGRVYTDLIEVDRAIEAYYQALLFDESDVWSANNLGLIYIRQGRFDEALAPLAWATELRGDIATFQNNLGVALERAGYVELAGEAFSAALEVDPTYDKARASLDRVSAHQRDVTLEPLDLHDVAQRFVETVRGDLEEVPVLPDTMSVVVDSAVIGAGVVDTAVADTGVVQADSGKVQTVPPDSGRGGGGNQPNRPK